MGVLMNNVSVLGTQVPRIKEKVHAVFGKESLPIETMEWVVAYMVQNGFITMYSGIVRVGAVFATRFVFLYRAAASKRAVPYIPEIAERAASWTRHVYEKMAEALVYPLGWKNPLTKEELYVVCDFCARTKLIGQELPVIFPNQRALGVFLEEYRKRRLIYPKQFGTACEKTMERCAQTSFRPT